jgi:serine/threonine protein kinase/Tfp pilus assembly protein PilF
MTDASPAESLFFAALELPPGDRAAFLEAACRSDTGLRARIEKMLAAQPDLGDFLGEPAPTLILNRPIQVEELPRPLSGSTIAGKYRLLGPIGEGGMGAVWVAEQLHPVTRRVAIKLIRGEHGGSRGILARFEAERQAIALMDHPHIAKLLDAGTTAEPEAPEPCGTPLGEGAETPPKALSIGAGRPYFVMELVDGLPLNEYCDRHRLTIPDRLHLFVQICRAVQHAHQKGIIHRDLKPSNILVEHHDGRPVPRVIDFGLAKATGGVRLPGETLFTRPGNLLGTPLYMAPEQASVDAADIDTRADIYALGVNLYELLTGTTPIGQEQLKQMPLLDLLHLIRDSDPPTPSQRLSSADLPPAVAANRQSEPVKLGRSLRGELDWIVMKALAKERDQRYETATAFAEDVERFLNHEPVLAGPPSAVYRLGKFVRRYRVQVIAAGLLLLALLAGIAGTTYGLLRAEHRREEAERARGHEAAQRVRAEKARDRTWEALEAMTSWGTGEALITQTSLSRQQEQFLVEVLAYYREFAAEQADDEPSRVRTVRAAARVGAIQSRLGRHADATPALRVACDGYTRLVADFPAVPEYRRLLAAAHNDLGLVLRELGKAAEAEAEIRKALAIQSELPGQFLAVPAHVSQLALIHLNLGLVLHAQGKQAEAVAADRKALAILEKLAGEFPADPQYRRTLATCHNNLGEPLNAQGKLPEAEKHVRQAISMQQKLVADFPNVREYHADLTRSQGHLGTVLMGRMKLAEAEEQYRKTLGVVEQLVAEFPAMHEYRARFADLHHNLGRVLRRLEKLSEAEGQYRKALAIEEELTSRFPAVPARRRHLAGIHISLGIALSSQGKLAEAVAEDRKALAILVKLAGEVPADPQHRLALAACHHNLGADLSSQGKLPTAEGHFRQALAIREQLPTEFRADPEYHLDFAAGHSGLSVVLEKLEKPQGAEEQYRKALAILEKLGAENPGAPRYRHERAVLHFERGILLKSLGKQPAEAEYRKALAVEEPLTAEYPAVPTYRQQLANIHSRLGLLLGEQGRGAEAEKQFRKAVAVWEKLAADFPAEVRFQTALGGDVSNFGALLINYSQPQEALVWLNRAVGILTAAHEQHRSLAEARNSLCNSHANRAIAYQRLGKYGEAIQDWDRAVALDPQGQKSWLRVRRARSLMQAGRVAEAVAEAGELAKAAQRDAGEICTLAGVYAQASSKLADRSEEEYAARAVELLRRAVKAGYRNAARIAQDPDLAPLRKRADFKKLLADLQQK